MFLRDILWIWVLAIAPAMCTSPSRHDSQLLSRLDRLESLLADHQAQYKREQDQWEKEKHALINNLHLLQEDVHALQREKQEVRKEMTALRNTQILAQSLVEENHDLKAEVGDLRLMLASINQKQASDFYSLQHGRDPDSSQHVHSVRSDDHGSLGVVTDHLAQQVTQLTADVQALKTSDSQQHQDIQTARGSTFIHWGSSTCPGSSETVYSGVLGGSYYDHFGAAATMLCLSMSPKLLNTTAGRDYTALYGGEYETSDTNHNKDPVCAVCRAPRSTTIMVPGSSMCSAGWALQYSGFLMAGHYSHKAATEFICVDSKLESQPHSFKDDNGRLLYYTETQCGSLPCPPYENNKEVTCAVCSK